MTTIETLDWARATSADNEIVRTFWAKLCESQSLGADSTTVAVLTELRENGGNSLANLFRSKALPYAEVAYDVAEALRSWGGDKPFTEGDVEACERFVLGKMEVKDDDIRVIASTIDGKADDDAVGRQVGKATAAAAAHAGLGAAARAVAEKMGQRAAAALAAKAAVATGKKVAKKAAEAAAKRAAEEVAKQVLKRILAALNVVLLAWTVVDIAGPATRKTIPGVTYVALLTRIHAVAAAYAH